MIIKCPSKRPFGSLKLTVGSTRLDNHTLKPLNKELPTENIEEIYGLDIDSVEDDYHEKVKPIHGSVDPWMILSNKNPSNLVSTSFSE